MTGMLAMERNRVWRRDHGAVLSGICVGLAEDLDLPLPLVRTVTVLFAILPAGVAYLALSMLLRRGPVSARRGASSFDDNGPVSARRGASSFDDNGPVSARRGRAPSRSGAPGAAPTVPSKEWALLRHRFETLEPRLKRIEAFVTSSEFELDRGFKRMGE